MKTKILSKTSLPAWFNVSDAAHYSGLSGALIYELIKDGCVVSSTVLRPGRRRGRRLVQRKSLDAYIEDGIGRKSSDNIRQGGINRVSK